MICSAGLMSLIFSHPIKRISPSEPFPKICSLYEKGGLIEQPGVNYLLKLSFYLQINLIWLCSKVVD